MHLNKEWVLVLNSLYQPIGVITIKKALVAMNSTKDGDVAAIALDLRYTLDEDGNPNWTEDVEYYPTTCEDWFSLPVRPWDVPINTPRLTIRAPIVLVAKNYDRMVMKEIHPTKRNLYKMYGGKCIWSNRKLSLNEASIEHMTPKSHKGKNTWGNLAIADKKLNSERGNIPVTQWKYKPQYRLKEPKKIPACALIQESVRPEWEYFLIHKNES